MRPISGFIAVGAAAALVAGLAFTAVHAQTTIQASNAWARKAPAMSGDHNMASGSMEKDKGHAMSASTGSMEKGHAMGGGNGAVYVTLTNPGAQADALLSAASDAAQTVELHEVKNESGVMKMRPVTTIPVPANGKTELKPGGYHIMLMGLKHDLKTGEKVPVTLKFERGGEMKIEAAIR